jgi:hypothetical protein
MGFGKIIKIISTPYGIMLLTVLLSFAAWLLPDFGVLRKGFHRQFSFFSPGFLVAATWYATAFVLAFLCYALALKKKLAPGIFDRYAPLHMKLPYVLLTLFALTGCLASYLVILSQVGVKTIWGYLMSGQANQLKYILYEDYSAGVLSLRYLAIHSCAMAIYRRYKLRLSSRLDFLNIALLLSIVVISSRLSLIMMVFVWLVLYVTHSEKIRISTLKLSLAGAGFFILLSILSYTRNKNFYEAKGQGFWTAGISEIVTYLGTPFQGAASVANNPSLIVHDPTNWTRYAYIEESLSTNSAFLQLFQTYGWYSFPIMMVTVAFFAFVVGFLKKQKDNYLFLSVLTILYAFAEFWRLYWFGTGIMLILTVFPIFITLSTIFLSRSAWRSTT